MMWLANSPKEAGKNLEQKSQIVTNNQTKPTTNNPAGFYMQPLVNVTTGIIENMGKELLHEATPNKNFDAQYKRPTECYNVTDAKILTKCTNDRRTARLNFENRNAK